MPFFFWHPFRKKTRQDEQDGQNEELRSSAIRAILQILFILSKHSFSRPWFNHPSRPPARRVGRLERRFSDAKTHLKEYARHKRKETLDDIMNPARTTTGTSALATRRTDSREAIFMDDDNRKLFQSAQAQARDKAGWVVHTDTEVA